MVGQTGEQALKSIAEFATKAKNNNGDTTLSSDVPALVVWGGIEPPTQGFSVLCSTD